MAIPDRWRAIIAAIDDPGLHTNNHRTARDRVRGPMLWLSGVLQSAIAQLGLLY